MRLTRRLIPPLLLGAAICTAQAPVVPTDHYGPPVCNAEPLPANRMSAAKAEAIEAAGAADPTALPSATPVENFDIARYRLTDYGACVGNGGCYWAELDAQYKRAESALDHQVALAQTRRKAGHRLRHRRDIALQLLRNAARRLRLYQADE